MKKNTHMLTIKGLHAGYGELQILKDVNVELKRGSLSVLMGPNGAGKSTLLKSIFNITNITAGSVLFEGEEITGLPPHALLNKGVAFVSQGRVNFSTLSIEDNLLLGAHHISDKALVQKRLEEVYEQFPILKERAKEYAFSLSGGQQQMLTIGRALMSHPKLLLMDEPTLGLAPKIVKEVFQTIVDIKNSFDTTILVVEHNIKSLLDVADEGFVLVQGEVVAHDSCAKLKKSPIMKKVFVGALE